MHISKSRYCCKCHTELSNFVVNHGWCGTCHDTVEVTRCKVPYWVLALTLALLWVVQFAGMVGNHLLH